MWESFSYLPRQPSPCLSFHCLVWSSPSFHSQKCPHLEGKLYGHESVGHNVIFLDDYLWISKIKLIPITEDNGWNPGAAQSGCRLRGMESQETGFQSQLRHDPVTLACHQSLWTAIPQCANGLSRSHISNGIHIHYFLLFNSSTNPQKQAGRPSPSREGTQA